MVRSEFSLRRSAIADRRSKRDGVKPKIGPIWRHIWLFKRSRRLSTKPEGRGIRSSHRPSGVGITFVRSLIRLGVKGMLTRSRQPPIRRALLVHSEKVVIKWIEPELPCCAACMACADETVVVIIAACAPTASPKGPARMTPAKGIDARAAEIATKHVIAVMLTKAIVIFERM